MDGRAVTGDQAWQYFHGQDRGSRYVWTCYHWWSSVAVFPWTGQGIKVCMDVPSLVIKRGSISMDRTEDQGMDGHAVTGDQAWQYFHGQDRGSRYGWTCRHW